jgi:hypothetical protein
MTSSLEIRARSAGLNRPSLAAAFGDKDAIYAGNGYAAWPQALSVKLLARLDRANFDLRINGSDLRTCLHAQCAVETAVEARRCG